MPVLRELWDDSLVATARAREILDAARAENREMNEEEEANWNAAIADSDRLANQVRQEIAVRDREASIAEHGRSLGYSQERVEDMRERQLNPPNPSVGQPQGSDRDARVRNFLLGRERGDVVPDATVRGEGVPIVGNGIRLRHNDTFFGTPRERIRAMVMWPDGSVRERDLEFDARQRDQTVGTNNRGGFTVETSLMRSLESAMLDFNSVEPVATIVRTMGGSPIGLPTSNDTTNKGERLGEATAATEQDIPFGQIALPVYKYSSKTVQISLELLQDSVFDMSSVIGDKLGERLGRILADDLTFGTGASQPQGIVTGATSGKVVTTSATLAYDDLIDLRQSVDRAYRQRGRAAWMFNSEMEGRAMKLRDANGLPIWHRDPRMGAPDTLHGYPIHINEQMNDLNGSNNRKVAIFGDLSKYQHRRAMDVELYRLDEHYIENGLIGFIAFCRDGGVLLDAGTNPVKALVDKA